MDSQVDQELLRQVRKVIADLGDAPYLKREPEEMIRPAPDAPPAGKEPEFKPFNRLPAGWNLVQTKAFLTAEGFAFDEEPKAGKGYLQASKYIGPEDTRHYVRIEFKGGYSVHVLEFAADSSAPHQTLQPTADSTAAVAAAPRHVTLNPPALSPRIP